MSKMKNQHPVCLTCEICRVLIDHEKLFSTIETLKKSPCHVICCSYQKGSQEQSTTETTEPNYGATEQFIYDKITPKVLHPIFRLVVAIALVAFLAASLAVTFTKIEVGFRPEHLANRHSNTYDFSVYSWKYLRDYHTSQRLLVLFNFTTSPFDRNVSKIHRHLLDIVERVEQGFNFVWDSRLNHVPIRTITMNKAQTSLLQDAVREMQMHEQLDQFKPRLEIDNNFRERLILFTSFQIREMSSLQRGSLLVQFIKTIQDTFETKQSDDFQIFISDYEQSLRVYDQVLNLPKQLVYFALITFGSTILVSFIMIPHPICIFWLAMSSAYIVIGTLFGMAMWDVSLDPVTLIYLLMAIGATADYICHTIYVFTVVCPSRDLVSRKDRQAIRYNKARRMMVIVITESLPAIVGTILSIIVLSTSSVYVLQSFFKVFLISVCVAVVFMSIVLPIVLCQFGPTDDSSENKRQLKQNQEKLPKINGKYRRTSNSSTSTSGDGGGGRGGDSGGGDGSGQGSGDRNNKRVTAVSQDLERYLNDSKKYSQHRHNQHRHWEPTIDAYREPSYLNIAKEHRDGDVRHNHHNSSHHNHHSQHHHSRQRNNHQNVGEPMEVSEVVFQQPIALRSSILRQSKNKSSHQHRVPKVGNSKRNVNFQSPEPISIDKSSNNDQSHNNSGH